MVSFVLQLYWKNTTQYHKTGDPIWLTMLDSMSKGPPGPEQRAATRFILSQRGRACVDTS